MISVLHFPEKKVMEERLSKDEGLNSSYYKQKGITKAIIDLAVVKLAESKMLDKQMWELSSQMIAELRCGKDSYSGESLPNLGRLGLPDMLWGQIVLIVEKALISCGKDAS